MTASQPAFTLAVHVTAYRDAEALARALTAIHAQTCAPALIRLVDNSPAPLALPLPPAQAPARILYQHLPANEGTAGAINRSITWGMESGVDYLWILDQDSEPGPGLLAGLVDAHQNLLKNARGPIGLVAPLTRNRDDGQPNAPLRFERFRSRTVPYATDPVECDFLPASGMLLHLPSLRRLKLPADAYFLDLYDFALGLAVKEAGAGVWMVPAQELSHQVGRKVTLTKNGRTQVFSDMPASRAHLLHRNSTHLYIRTARGFDKLLAAGWQGRRAVLQAWRFITYGFDQRWSKAAAALTGWALGLFGLAPARNPAGVK
jgi:GT2 family glycosyltransferase